MAWWRWRGFGFYRSWFPCPMQQLFSPVFQRVVGGLLNCFPADRFRQQTASCKAIVPRWTQTTLGCHFLLHLLLHHPQSSCSSMDAELSKSSAISFTGIHWIVLEIMDILAVLLLSSEKKFPFSILALVTSSFCELTTSISRRSMLYYFRTRQKPPYQTRSNKLSWSRWNHEKAPSGVPNTFPPTAFS